MRRLKLSNFGNTLLADPLSWLRLINVGALSGRGDEHAMTRKMTMPSDGIRKMTTAIRTEFIGHPRWHVNGPNHLLLTTQLTLIVFNWLGHVWYSFDLRQYLLAHCITWLDIYHLNAIWLIPAHSTHQWSDNYSKGRSSQDEICVKITQQ